MVKPTFRPRAPAFGDFGGALAPGELRLDRRQFPLAQRGRQFVAMDDGGADLADDNARGRIGQPRRIGQRRAPAQRTGQRRNHRIAGPRDVENLARLGLQMMDIVRRDDTHALLRARDQDGVDPVRGHQSARRFDDPGIAGRRRACGLGKFLAIGRDDGSTRIARIVAALGIDDDRHPGRLRRRDRRRRDGGRQHALAIVGQNQHLTVGKRRFERGDQRRALCRVERGRGFAVGTQHLLAHGDEARLDGGDPAGNGAQPRIDTGMLREGPDKRRTRLVVAGHREENHIGTERGQIARHIARPARHGAFGLDAENRNRCLGRNALDPAIDEAVEHRIAEHQRPHAGKMRDKRLNIRAFFGHKAVSDHPASAIMAKWRSR